MPKLDLSIPAPELEAYLTEQRTVRLATVSPDGRPQVVPLWFVWLDGAVFLNSTRGNVTIRNLERRPVATGVVDDGLDYAELRGVVLEGRVDWADDDPRLEVVKDRWSRKYLGGNPIPYDRWRGRVWFRLVPDRVSSWDFRRIPQAKAKARSEEGSS